MWAASFGRGMAASTDVVLEAFCGSRTRLLTLGVLASAEAPLSGYRLALVADLPREKVYPELRKAIAAGSVAKTEFGYSLVDPDLRQLLRSRIRVVWNSNWDRLGSRSSTAVDEELREIRKVTRKISLYDPGNRIPPNSLRELERDPEKNRALRRLGLRPSRRKKK
jgi:hypothetical protein